MVATSNKQQGGDPLCIQLDIDESKIKTNVDEVEILAEDIFVLHKPRFYDDHLKITPFYKRRRSNKND